VTAAAIPLPEVIDSLRSKGLRRGVTPLPGHPEPVRSARAIPSGHRALDAALRGGWPRGSLALLDGAPGTGGTSLALAALAGCQRDGGLAAWVDVERSFDATGAARLGIRLEWLLLVRPADAAEGLELAGWLARSRLLDLLVLDLGQRGGGASLPGIDRLAQLLVRTGTTALTLTGSSETVARAAGVRVALERRAWLAVGRDLVGQRVKATVIRHRAAAVGGRAELDLWFAEGRRIDPLLSARAVPQSAGIEAEPDLRVMTA